MAEAFAVIGLAAGIVQFVDCGFRWAITAQELAHSREGSLEENNELENIVNHLLAQVAVLKSNSTLFNHRGLDALVGVCSQLAKELKVILDTLKVDRTKSQRREIIRKSFNNLRKRGKIKDIERRLFKIRDEICFHLQVILL
jgi:hypothetical protein